MKDILIYGAGGFGREIACLIKDINATSMHPHWQLLGFIDDGVAVGTDLRYGKVLGGKEYFEQHQEPVAVVVAIAEPKVLRRVVEGISDYSFIEFPNLVAPNAQFFDEESFTIGQGNVLFHGCRFSCDVSLGNFNMINGQVAFGHDVKIGDYNCFGPSARLSGHVEVGDGNFFGLGSAVIQNKKVPDNVRLGIMSVLMRNAHENQLYFGNPAKKIQS